MSVNVIGLFKSQSDAQGAVNELLQSGFNRQEVSVITSDERGEFQRYAPNASTGDISHGDRITDDATKGAEAGGIAGGLIGLIAGLGALAIPGIGVVAGPLVGLLGGAALGAAGGGLIGALVGMGVPESHAKAFASGVKSGGTLVVVHTTSDRAGKAEQILNRYNPSEVNEEASTGAATTPATSVAPRPAVTPVSSNAIDTKTADGQRLEIVKEELEIGKREVERGGLRVRSYVTETPVAQQVTLREEHVNVERHAVDRPATPQDLDTFKESTIELRETAEVPVVAKTARVVEEVMLSKSAEQRTETVNEVVRETHVDVEPIQEFKRDFQRDYAGANSSFEQYSPAYSYGYRNASDPRFAGREWTSVEPELQRDWERDRPGTWAQYRSAIRSAWERKATATPNKARLL